MDTQIFRVTVRGRFGELSEAAHAYLVGHVDEHRIERSGYTPEGTFTYDERIAFFNLRSEVRTTEHDGAAAAGAIGLAEAETFLSTMGFSHRGLKVTVTDLSKMWEAASRRPRAQRSGGME